MITKLKKQIYIVIGTRAQLIKMAPIMLRMNNRKIPYSFIYTAQHIETIDDIRNNFKLKKPDIILVPPKETKTLGLFGKWFLQIFYKLIMNRKKIIPRPGIVITHGDTTSSVWGALLGKLTKSKVIHIESGLRSFNLFKPFPEEINRLITFSLTDVFVCPNKWAINNLKKYNGIKINTKENTQYDSVRFAIKANLQPKINLPKKYILVSIHRFEHVFDAKKLKRIVDLILLSSKKYHVIFILHPVTKKQLELDNLLNKLSKNNRIILSDRFSFFEFITLLRRSEFVITDGGSNQEELSYLGKPTIILRDVTERTEGLNKNAKLINFDFSEFNNFLNNYSKYIVSNKKLKTSPSKIFVDWIEKNIYE